MTQTIVPPPVADAQLLFDDVETRDILRFFWPHHAARIAGLTLTNDVRRFAQTILIAAIDASYIMIRG